MYHGHADGVERGDEFVRRARAGRPSLYERYCDLHGGDSARPAGRFPGRRRGRVPGRSALLPDADVRLPRHTWFAGGCDFGLCAPCDEEASRAGFGTWRGDWRGHHGRGLFAGPRVHLQHAGICDAEAALPDFAGGGRCGGRHGAVLECGIHKLFDRLQQRI